MKMGISYALMEVRMNRNIQSEGTVGILKWNKSYKRFFRRGEKM